jgi:acid phosphatase (class A)
MRSTIAATVMLIACAAVPHAAGAQMATNAGASTPYLKPADLPDPRAYLPGPPAPGSPAMAADRAAYESALAGRDGPAWKAAAAQLRINSPAVAQQLMCAIGAKLDPTPNSAYGRLLRRSGTTLAVASEGAKAVWNRDRPYAADKGAICDPEADFGKQSPSYPSGHAGMGWLWGLMLAELVPDRADALLKWGVELGDNRLACRVHFPSDVAAGRTMAAALYARLQAEPAFRADMAAAKAEIAAARPAGPPAGCDT